MQKSSIKEISETIKDIDYELLNLVVIEEKQERFIILKSAHDNLVKAIKDLKRLL